MRGRHSDERYALRKDGVYRLERAEDGCEIEHARRICSPLEVKALTRSFENDCWGVLLGVEDPDGVVHEIVINAELAAGKGEELQKHLARYGCRYEPGAKARQAVQEYVQPARVAARARCVDTIGWHDAQFVLPDKAFAVAETEERVLLDTGSARENAFQTAGSLADWRDNVAAKAVGNSRLTLALSAAFVGPLLYLLRAEGGGLHFRGASSSGKSTTLIAAGSVWGGGPRGFMRSWRSTDNGLEALAAEHSDTLLCLDELSQASPTAAGQAAYMLANGKGKQRARRSGAARRPLEWRCWFQSTGETGLQGKLMEGGERSAAGMAVRVVEVAADAGRGLGLFEELHGAPDAASFANSLKAAANAHYGTAGRAFLERLVREPAAVAERLTRRVAQFVSETSPPGADGQVTRVAQRFGLVAAAGELAVDWALLPWPQGMARAAARRCFLEWVEERGGHEAAELTEAKRRIRAFIEQHGAARFQDWDQASASRPILHRAGFVRRPKPEQADQRPVFFFNTSTWDAEIIAGSNKRLLNKGLIADGVIVPDARTGTSSRAINPRSCGSCRAYEIARDFLAPASLDNAGRGRD